MKRRERDREKKNGRCETISVLMAGKKSENTQLRSDIDELEREASIQMRATSRGIRVYWYWQLDEQKERTDKRGS